MLPNCPPKALELDLDCLQKKIAAKSCEFISKILVSNCLGAWAKFLVP